MATMRPTILVTLCLLTTGAARAEVTVFDFETTADLAAWKLHASAGTSLTLSGRFATSGRSSLAFTTPAWKPGASEWPSFDASPPMSDWRGYDRLVIDVTSVGGDRYSFALFVSDSRVPFRKGLAFRLDIPGRGYRRITVPLSRFPATVDRTDIAILHFFATRPPSDMQVHLDRVTLLRPGESAPPPPRDLTSQLAELCRRSADVAERAIAASRKAIDRLPDTVEVKRNASELLNRQASRIRAMRDELRSPSISLPRVATLEQELSSQPRLDERFAAEARFFAAFDRSGLDHSAMVVGKATSMVKILPRAMPFEIDATDRIALSVARNETESFQVAVMPRSAPLRDVSVTVSELRSPSGSVLSANDIDCDVVGYVKTERRPPYKVSHVGWWPDPILDFLDGVDIATGDLQTFWVRVRTPKSQPPGKYAGTLRVSAAGVPPLTIALEVVVRKFTLPDHSPLPTAITFFERKSQMGGAKNWPRMKLEYADFLADYYIDYDSLYRKEGPDYEIVQRLHDQGRLVAFNLGNVFNAGTRAEGFDRAIAKTVERIRPAYDHAKRLGLLDHAYIYGFDERPKEQFALLEKSAQALRRAFPDVVLMTTSYDHSYGLDSVVKTIDAWCPLTPRFHIGRAQKARAEGRSVWWYICCGPHNPHANWFVEYAAIESRLLMGAMTAKYRPDGFLYYSLSIWNKNQPIEDGPFTSWNPVSWTVYHGDGSLLCSGPGGRPVPTIRLENYRDGLEDFAYALILEEIVGRYERRESELSDAEKSWLAEARSALPVPDTLVRTMAEYSRDPRVLYAYRDRLGDLIDRSGVTDADPWGANFGVRGFAPR